MKKFALLLVLFPFLLNYSFTNQAVKKVKVTGNSTGVNFSVSTPDFHGSNFLPDTTDTDTLIKS